MRLRLLLAALLAALPILIATAEAQSSSSRAARIAHLIHKLKHLHDIDAPSPANNEVLSYQTASGKWEPRTIAAVGGGDVTGPASATDAYLCVFDSTTGKLIRLGNLYVAGSTIVSTSTSTNNVGYAVGNQPGKGLGWTTGVGGLPSLQNAGNVAQWSSTQFDLLARLRIGTTGTGSNAQQDFAGVASNGSISVRVTNDAGASTAPFKSLSWYLPGSAISPASVLGMTLTSAAGGTLIIEQIQHADFDKVFADTPVVVTAATRYYYADTSAGAIEFDLEACDVTTDGVVHDFKIVRGANTVTLDPNSTEEIQDGTASLVFSGALDSRTIRCQGEGTNQGWWVH